LSDDAFEYIIPLPAEKLEREARRLIGFHERYARVRADLRLLADPAAVLAWGQKLYGEVPPICEVIGDRYPLFILEGDVGTGKTVFARCAASRLAMELQRDGNLFALSTRVRGKGAVGEASAGINAAFARVAAEVGKTKLAFLLIDEADSLVTSRGEAHSHLEDKIAVNTIIQKVDDLRRHGGRFVVFLSTNRIGTLDAGVLRRAAALETFERPTPDERKRLLVQDLEGLGLASATIDQLVQATGSSNGSPGYTFSDMRTRLLPRIIIAAYPDRRITDADALAATDGLKPSPVVT